MIDYSDLNKWLKEKCNKSFNVSEISDMRVLDLSFCKLESLHKDIALLPNLKHLECQGNYLEEINLKSSSLISFSCTSNKIENLNLETPNLRQLWCSGNKLRVLELNCPNLINLFCESNKITKIILDCPLLNTFYCEGNKFRFKRNDPMIKIFKSFNLHCYEIYEASEISGFL